MELTFADRHDFSLLPFYDGNICADQKCPPITINMPKPSNAKSLNEFLRMPQFCDRFIAHFSTITDLLHALTQPSVPFQCTIECQAAFDEIKYMLTTAPVLCAPLNSDFFILETNACYKGEVTCLKVRSNTNKTEHIVAYDKILVLVFISLQYFSSLSMY